MNEDDFKKKVNYLGYAFSFLEDERRDALYLDGDTPLSRYFQAIFTGGDDGYDQQFWTTLDWYWRHKTKLSFPAVHQRVGNLSRTSRLLASLDHRYPLWSEAYRELAPIKGSLDDTKNYAALLSWFWELEADSRLEATLHGVIKEYTDSLSNTLPRRVLTTLSVEYLHACKEHHELWNTLGGIHAAWS